MTTTTMQRLWKPRMYQEYYQTSLLLSPLFWVATLLAGTTVFRLVSVYHNSWTLTGIVAVAMVLALWSHLIIQHRRISRAMAAQSPNEELLFIIAWSTTAFWIPFFIVVNALLSKGH